MICAEMGGMLAQFLIKAGEGHPSHIASQLALNRVSGEFTRLTTVVIMGFHYRKATPIIISMEDLRTTTNLLKVFKVLLDDQDAQHYALDLSKSAKVNVGTIYALVARLQRAGLLKSDLEDVDPVIVGRPPRRYYRLTGEGIQYARQTLSDHRADLGLTGGAHA